MTKINCPTVATLTIPPIRTMPYVHNNNVSYAILPLTVHAHPFYYKHRVRRGLTPRGHPCASFFAKNLQGGKFMDTQPVRPQPILTRHSGAEPAADPIRGRNPETAPDKPSLSKPSLPCEGRFTNFAETSYEKTRNSYNQCEVPPLTASVRPEVEGPAPRQDGAGTHRPPSPKHAPPSGVLPMSHCDPIWPASTMSQMSHCPATKTRF